MSSYFWSIPLICAVCVVRLLAKKPNVRMTVWIAALAQLAGWAVSFALSGKWVLSPADGFGLAAVGLCLGILLLDIPDDSSELATASLFLSTLFFSLWLLATQAGSVQLSWAALASIALLGLGLGLALLNGILAWRTLLEKRHAKVLQLLELFRRSSLLASLAFAGGVFALLIAGWHTNSTTHALLFFFVSYSVISMLPTASRPGGVFILRKTPFVYSVGMFLGAWTWLLFSLLSQA